MLSAYLYNEPDDSLEDLELADLMAKFKSMGTPTSRKVTKRLSLPENAFFRYPKNRGHRDCGE